MKIACSACRTETSNYYIHELLSVPVCDDCKNFYYSGSFSIDDSTGNETYCRWCGQGEGTLFLCDACPRSFCERCLENNFGSAEVERLKTIKDMWACIVCSPQPLMDLIRKNRWNELTLPSAKPVQPPKPVPKKTTAKTPTVESKYIVCYDIARGRENFEIPVINEYDDEPAPLDFVYINKPVVNHGATLTNNPDFLLCCTCEDNCRDASKCECAIASGGGAAYDIDGRLVQGKVEGIYECNYKCHCHKRSCKNRVVSNGPQLKLEVFRCPNDKGWGVRCKTDIEPGTFIADYIGEIIPEALVEKRGLEKCDQYLFNMDSWARARACYCLSSLGLKTPLDKMPREHIVDASRLDEEGLAEFFDEDLIKTLSNTGAIRRAQEKGQRKRKLREAETKKNKKNGDKSPQSWYDEYIKDRKSEWHDATTALGDRVMIETEEIGESYTIDARWYGSIGRFLNHSCQPNLDILPVFCDSQNAMMPRIAFFAHETIKAGTELVYDYGYFEGNVDGKHRTCLCGAEYCRKILY